MNAGETNLPSRLAVWPVEDRALVELLRMALGTRPALFQWPAELEAETFQKCMQRHRVGAFLHQRLGGTSPGYLPAAVRELLREAARRTATLALTRSAELVRVARLFQAAGVQFLSVKGPLLAQALYGEVGGRHAGDLDLLIAPSQLKTADQALRADGYRRSQPDFELTPRQWQEYQRLKHEFEYFNDVAQVRIEVEWRLEGLPGESTHEWLAVGERHHFGGVEISRLPAELEFLYLFVHGAGHGWFRLFWLVDVALLLMRADVNWHSLMQLARTHRVETCLWQGGQLAEMLLNIPLPEALRVPARQVARVNWLTHAALRSMCLSEQERSGLMELFRQTRYQLRLRQNWTGKAAVLRPRIMSPANWKMLPLPDRWFALYYAVAPWLWLRRRLGSKPLMG